MPPLRRLPEPPAGLNLVASAGFLDRTLTNHLQQDLLLLLKWQWLEGEQFTLLVYGMNSKHQHYLFTKLQIEPTSKIEVEYDGSKLLGAVKVDDSEDLHPPPFSMLYFDLHTYSGLLASENKIEIALNGPILVHGKIELTHSDGRKESKEKVTALCRCGASSNKPFCDGTHNNIGFKG